MTGSTGSESGGLLEDRIARRFALYDLETGRVRARIEAPPAVAELNLRVGEALLEIGSSLVPEETYILDDAPTERPVLEFTIDGTVTVGDLAVLELPVGAEVRIGLNGDTATIDETGALELEYVEPGLQELEIRAFPYKTARVVIVVEEA